jgi:hypothetical protein
MYNNISEEDKERLLFNPESGVWSGYKHPFGFKVSLFPAVDRLSCSIEPIHSLIPFNSVIVDLPMALNNSTGTDPTGRTSTASLPASTPLWMRSSLLPITSPVRSTVASWRFSPAFSSSQTTTFGKTSSHTAAQLERVTSGMRSSDLFRRLQKRLLKAFECMAIQTLVLPRSFSLSLSFVFRSGARTRSGLCPLQVGCPRRQHR